MIIDIVCLHADGALDLPVLMPAVVDCTWKGISEAASVDGRKVCQFSQECLEYLNTLQRAQNRAP
jgi:hypothetical protein